MLSEDFTTATNNTALRHVEQTVGLPDYVKGTSLTKEAGERLHRSAFADGIRKLFPLHTKAATYESVVFYVGNTACLDENFLGKMKSAAEAHGILADVEAAIGALQTHAVKSAATTSQPRGRYALELEHENSQVSLFYPINDAYDVEESARHMAKDASDGKLPIDVLRRSAVALVKRAHELQVATRRIPSYIRNLGEERLPDFQRAEELTRYRCKHAGLSAEATAIYLELVKEASEDPDALDTYVDLYHEMDAGCQIKYSNLMPDPFTVFFSGATITDFEKLAKETVVLQDDVMVPAEVFGRMSDLSLKANFPEEKAARLIQLKSASAADITLGVPDLMADETDYKVLYRLLLDASKS